jgi:hypothetical protein
MTHGLFLGLESRRRGSDSTRNLGSTADNTLVDSGFDAVVHLEVKLWKLVLLVSAGFLNVSEGRRIDNVADNESANSLILGDGLSSRDASALGGGRERGCWSFSTKLGGS